jgi:hypothetical protein
MKLLVRFFLELALPLNGKISRACDQYVVNEAAQLKLAK